MSIEWLGDGDLGGELWIETRHVVFILLVNAYVLYDCILIFELVNNLIRTKNARKTSFYNPI